jgi:hypothetical protein
MTQIILETIKPHVIKKLQTLAQKNHRSLEDEITAILEYVTETEEKITHKNKGWQPGFFEEVIGGWEGKPLVREPQPEAQEREPLL